MSGRKWVLGAVAGVLTLGGTFAAAQAPPAPAKPPAVVNGEVITQAELEAVLRQAGPTPVAQPEAQRRQAQMQALSFLMDKILLRQFLAKNAPPADAAEVARKMQEVDGDLRKHGKSRQEWLADVHQTEEQLRGAIAEDIQWHAYARRHLTDADLEQYYRDARDFFDRTTVRVSHILLRLPSTATESERAQARGRLADLRAQVLAGRVDFAEAARAQSQCPSAEKGGDLGFILRKWMVEEPFARAAFALQPGQVSDVVETEFGLHLLKVTERKPGTPSDFARIKEDVREICIEDMRQNVLMQARKAARVEINLP
jgi:peptidyl-prolyl cis-trans isomerase C